MKNDKNFIRLTPFKMQVLQSFPFIDADFDALTNYELLCKVVEYLNITTENVNLLDDEYKTLYNYVHDYFDNLDLQTEVDNKLDEMAESGELIEIISQYLEVSSILAFNNVSALEDAQNLINGSFAKTYGKITYNDGLGAFYKIRTLINTDVIDGDNLVALTNFPTLVAEKMPDTNISNIIDDITSINNDIEDINTDITSLNSKVNITNILKNKKVIIMGDSLDITGRWGTYFINYSGCNGENYGNGSAGFVSAGITPPYDGMNFGAMLNSIISNKTTEELASVEYFIVGGGINDALNSNSVSTIKTAVSGFISSAKTAFPNAKIIIFPINTFTWLKDIEIARYNAIIETCKENGVMTTDDFLFWTIDDTSINSGDMTHLTDAGYQKLANYILSFINGTKCAVIENIEYELNENWSIFNTFSIFKIGNIVHITGVLHYSGGAITELSEILTFTRGSRITGSSNFNKYIPCVYYAGGSDSFSTVNVLNGALKTGRPLNYTSLSSPYLYINGSFPLGTQ